MSVKLHPSVAAERLLVLEAVADLYPHLPEGKMIYGDAKGWDMTQAQVRRIIGNAKRDRRFPDVPSVALMFPFPEGLNYMRCLFVGWDGTDGDDIYPVVLNMGLCPDGDVHFFASLWIRGRGWSDWLDMGTEEDNSHFLIAYTRLEMIAEGEIPDRGHVILK